MEEQEEDARIIKDEPGQKRDSNNEGIVAEDRQVKNSNSMSKFVKKPATKRDLDAYEEKINEGEMQIDTSVKQQSGAIEQERNFYPNQYGSEVDPKKLQMAYNIFGENDDEPKNLKTDGRKVQSTQAVKDMFAPVEIDDPFSSKQDQLIAERDIPERIQLKNLTNPLELQPQLQ